MKRARSDKTIEVVEGVYLKRKRSGCWHYYFKIGGKQFRKTTDTSDDKNAAKIALNAYQSTLSRQDAGMAVECISFKTLVKKYTESIQDLPKHKFHSETLHRHYMGFFKRYDDISKINLGALNDYLLYRKEKSGFKILNQSLNKEIAAFNQMMTLAAEYGWVSKDLKIKRQSEAHSRNRRPSFTIKEYRRLLQTSRRRTESVSIKLAKGQSKSLTIFRYWQRALLHDIIILLANTGMRVDEVKTITWRDIDWINKTIKLNAAGKTKSYRVVIVRTMGLQALRRVRDRRLCHLNDDLSLLDEKEPIQSLPNGTFVASFKKGFRELLKESGFEYTNKHQRHSLTSLRHTYATMKLTAPREKRASMRALSKQMGTSQKMIEQHYGHDVIEDYREELLG